MITDFDALLDAAALPERTVPVCLRGDLVAQFEELDRQLDQVRKESTNSLGGGEGLGELAEEIEALREEMRSHTYTFRLRALPRRAWRALIAQHPPRRVEDEEGKSSIHTADRVLGVNGETFFDALIRRCVVDPPLTEEQWLKLDATLTDAQWEKLTDAAWYLNRGEVDVPFSRAASRISRASEPE